MSRRHLVKAVLMFALAMSSAPVTTSIALAHGEGPDHHDETPSMAASQTPSIESVGTALELVAVAKGQELTIYLDRSATNEPVIGAAIEVDSEGQPTLVAKEHEPGTYTIVSEWLKMPGSKPLIFTLQAGDEIELLNGTLAIPSPADSADAHTAPGFADLIQLPMVWLLAVLVAATGFIAAFAFRPRPIAVDGKKVAGVVMAGLLATVAHVSSPTSAMAGPGHDHGEMSGAGADKSARTPRRAADGSLFIPKDTQRLLGVRTTAAASSTAHPATELIGTIISDPSSEGHVQSPMDGQITLADGGIAHIGQRVKSGDVLARLTPSIPVFDRGSLQQLTAEVIGKIRIAEQRLARLKRISSVIAQKDIDDTTTELEALREQKRVLEPKDTEVIELKAPVDGVIATSNVRAGQVVNARDSLFDIVDPERLWVEVNGIGGRDDSAIVSAVAIDGEGHRIALSYIGQAPVLRNHAHPILFRVENAHPALVIGSVVKILVQSGPQLRGLIITSDAVVRADNGLPQVWVKQSPETFAARLITMSPIDGARIVVTAGVGDGERVVTRGAELINQVR